MKCFATSASPSYSSLAWIFPSRDVACLGSRVQPGGTSGSRESRNDHGPAVGVRTMGSPLHHVRGPTGDERLIAGR